MITLSKRTLRRRVRSYVKNLPETGPLYFEVEMQDYLENLYKKLTLKTQDLDLITTKLVTNILYLSQKSSSYRAKNKNLFETGNSRRRSTIDIYRHLMSVIDATEFFGRNKITVYKCMKTVANLCEQRVIIINGKRYNASPNYCSDVNRFVTYLFSGSKTNTMFSLYSKTEFGFLATQLKNID